MRRCAHYRRAVALLSASLTHDAIANAIYRQYQMSPSPLCRVVAFDSRPKTKGVTPLQDPSSEAEAAGRRN